MTRHFVTRPEPPPYVAAVRTAWLRGVCLALPILAIGLGGPAPTGSPLCAADYRAEVSRDHPCAWWRFQDSTTADKAVARDEAGRHPGSYQGGVSSERAPRESAAERLGSTAGVLSSK